MTMIELPVQSLGQLVRVALQNFHAVNGRFRGFPTPDAWNLTWNNFSMCSMRTSKNASSFFLAAMCRADLVRKNIVSHLGIWSDHHWRGKKSAKPARGCISTRRRFFSVSSRCLGILRRAYPSQLLFPRRVRPLQGPQHHPAALGAVDVHGVQQQVAALLERPPPVLIRRRRRGGGIPVLASPRRRRRARDRHPPPFCMESN